MVLINLDIHAEVMNKFEWHDVSARDITAPTLPRGHYRARRYRAGHYRAGHYRALT